MDQVAQDVKKVFTGFSEKPNEALFDHLKAIGAAVIGSPEEVVRELSLYKEAGVEELIIGHLSADAVLNLENIANYVRPYL